MRRANTPDVPDWVPEWAVPVIRSAIEPLNEIALKRILARDDWKSLLPNDDARLRVLAAFIAFESITCFDDGACRRDNANLADARKALSEIERLIIGLSQGTHHYLRFLGIQRDLAGLAEKLKTAPVTRPARRQHELDGAVLIAEVARTRQCDELAGALASAYYGREDRPISPDSVRKARDRRANEEVRRSVDVTSQNLRR